MVAAARARPLQIAASIPSGEVPIIFDDAVGVVGDRIPLGWQRLKDGAGALLRRSGIVGRLPKTSGFQVDSAGIGLCCRAAEPGV